MPEPETHTIDFADGTSFTGRLHVTKPPHFILYINLGIIGNVCIKAASARKLAQRIVELIDLAEKG